jgi:hypothetical protein
VDPLQRLHTLDNLAELLRRPPPGAPRTLRDDRLQVCWTAAAQLLHRWQQCIPWINRCIVSACRSGSTHHDRPLGSLRTSAGFASSKLC